MSKTKENAIDPLNLMDELGTDALRFTLLVGSTPGKDMNLSIKKVEANRNFANKLWNASRFVLGALDQSPTQAVNAHDPTLADKWITARLNELVRDVDRLFGTHLYGEAGRQIYEFFWNEFADWYVEIAKVQIRSGNDIAFYTAQILARVMDVCLRLLHPFTPFVTEELWGFLKSACNKNPNGYSPDQGWEEALIIAHWPVLEAKEEWEDESIKQFNLTVLEPVKALRNMRRENNISPSHKCGGTITINKDSTLLQRQSTLIAHLAHIDPLTISSQITEALKQYPSQSLGSSGMVAFIQPLKQINSAAKKDVLQKELSLVENQIERLAKLLASDFGKKAPASVVEKEKQKLLAYQESAQKIKEQLIS